MEGSVLEVRYKKARSEMVTADKLNFIAGEGIEGDHYRGLPRQVLLLDKGTLDEFGYQPGDLREQILVDFPGLQGLANGTKLTVGTAELEILQDCAPCVTMAGYMGEDAQIFVNKMMGKRGMLARVSKSGSAAPGDRVAVIE